MLLAALLALVWFLTKDQNALVGSAEPERDKTHLDRVADNYPFRMVDDEMLGSFAGRTQINVRAPFGPNSQEHHVIDKNFVNDREYQRNYQTNLTEMRIVNQDWRLDDNMNGSPEGKYLQQHRPLDNLHHIRAFSETAPALETNEFFAHMMSSSIY